MGWEALGGALALAGSVYAADRQASATSKAARQAREAADRQTAQIRQNTVDTLRQNSEQFATQQAALQAQYASEQAYQQSLQVAAQVSQKVQEAQQQAAQDAAIDAAQSAEVDVNNDQSTYVDSSGVRRPIREKYTITQQGNAGSGLSI